MKHSRSQVRGKVGVIPALRFDKQILTSFAGLVVVQKLFTCLGLAERLRPCFAHQQRGKVFSLPVLFLQLVVHILIGFRELRDVDCYRDDPLVKRVLGLKRIPDAATLSRMLKGADDRSVAKVQRVLTELVLKRLYLLNGSRITLDFDGSVLSTSRKAQGVAVGFNKKKKGARSYYPLFCTVAQTGQVLDFLHRSGNVHDSNGARAFIRACVDMVRQALPAATIEVRMDSAFFSDEIVTMLDQAGVEFTISVPFERFAKLKQLIEARRRWKRYNGDVSFFESDWKPDCWDRRHRFIFVRTRAKKQQKEPVQLDLFIPYEYGYDFKVVVTNKTTKAKNVVAYHDGRGSQEGVFAELKSQCAMGYVPVRTLAGNQMYLLANLFAHNLARELQMIEKPPQRGLTERRAALWEFERLGTLRARLLCRAGRLTRPRGILTLTMNLGHYIQTRLPKLLAALRPAA
jgi:hypothetical protein